MLRLSRWSVFREVYAKVILSIIFVIGAMLALQMALNHLKLRALAADATSSRLQVSASAIERAIVRADSLGFAIDQMAGLQDLIDRERARDTSIEQILIVSPVGTPILVSGADQLPDSEQDQVLRRVLGSGDTLTRLDTGPRLYTGRLLFDSSAAVMGAVILTTPTASFIDQARIALDRMGAAYLMIFALISAIIAPFIIVQFRSVRHAYRVLAAEVDGADMQRIPSADALHDAIVRGNATFHTIERDFEDLVRKSQTNGGDA